MNLYHYDLHIHSCLSPCADDDMTPGNIAGMGSINGLQIMALTDHNTCGNCPPFTKACRKFGIIPVPGMELTTSEEVHIICLFPSLEEAMPFSDLVHKRILPIKNKPEIFGNQFFTDENDEVCGSEEILLMSATDIDISEAIKLVREHGGICYPAHIDRPANGIVAVLGDIPESYNFKCVEFIDKGNEKEYREKYPSIKDCLSVCNSDAHQLWKINEAEKSLEIEDEPYSGALVRKNLLLKLINK